MMVILVLVLVASSLQVGIISGNDQVDSTKATDDANILDRIEELEKRDNERETERQLWKQQMDRMKSQIAVVLTENSELKRDIVELNDRVAAVERESEELRNELKSIKSEKSYIETNEKDGSTIEQNIKISSKIRQNVRGVNTSIGNTVDRHTKNNVVQNKRKVQVQRIQRADNELGVAFYGTLSKHLQHAGANQIIAFDHIYTNEGNAYNVHAGDFRAPVAGTYVFSTTLMAYGSHTTHYYFAKNGSNVGNIYVRGQESPNASTSATIVLRLNAGDDVAVRNVDSDEFLHAYSLFSGFLLQQDYSAQTGPVVGKR